MRSGMLLKNTMKSIKDQQIELTAAESFKVADAYARYLKVVTMPSLTSNFPLKKLSQIKMVLTTNTRTNSAGLPTKEFQLIH